MEEEGRGRGGTREMRDEGGGDEEDEGRGRWKRRG